MKHGNTGNARWAKIFRRAGLSALALVATVGLAIVGLLYWQGSKKPDASGQYVALGSSFAAGIGLGPHAPGSPLHCLRTSGGYPAIVSRRTGLRLVDMTCSGSKTGHIIDGGQLLLGPQLAAVGPGAKLVTITAGGNDVDYVGDLMAVAGNMGRLGAWWHGDILPAEGRPYSVISRNIGRIASQIRQIAPKAVIVVVSYPAIIPDSGNCAASGVADRQAAISLEVARRLSAVTRQAANKAKLQFVDMGLAGAGHDVCSDRPWVNGAVTDAGTPFHPNSVGVRATADRIVSALPPAGSL